MFFVFIVSAQAQKTVTGTVNSGGLPLPGANVKAKGTAVETSADIDGKFTINVPTNATTLVVSFIGYATKEVAITNGIMIIELTEQSNNLEEVVINVGYGTQKKSVVTGAISKVTAKDLEKVPNGRIEQSLQGRTAGVTIAMNAGQPGASSTVRVRGITTLNGGNNPIWVIDGVIVDPGALGAINQSDIESIEVLKDAASSAIYGARSAAGVILVTTKKGKSGKMSVTYNGFEGISSPERTLKLLNATQYGAIMNERYVNGGGTGNIPYPDLGSLGKGTDWQKAIFNDDARRYSHELSLSGGGDVSNYYFSFGTQSQEGIVLPEISSYQKKNIRLNTTHKVKDWLTVGQTIGYTHQKSVGIGDTNSEYGGPLSSAIHLDPTTPIIETDPILANGIAYSNPYVIRDAQGNPYGISSVVGQEMTNPLAYSKTRRGQYNWSDDFIGNVFAEVKPLKGFKFRTAMGAKLAYWGGQGFTPLFYLSPTVNNTTLNNISRVENRAFNWNIENTLVYDGVYKDHTFSALLGQGVYKDNQFYKITGATHYGLATNDYSEASFNDETVILDNKIGFGYDVPAKITTSLFARLTYDYKEKYLFTGLLRRDGSSRFGANNKYGNFPSFSVGWVPTKEDFWKQNKIINSLKLRGGYGVTGNDVIDPFLYLAVIGGSRNYTFGNSGVVTPGSSPGRISNPDLKWEETTQSNIGFDAKILNDFTLTVEWYKKETSGILRENPIPGYVGAELPPFANIADMNNTGFEFELGYRKSINDFNISANANFATIKNEITNLGANVDYFSGPGFQSMGPVTRTQVGHAYNNFYGYQTMGIFQNQEEIDAYTNTSGGLIQPNAVPGDFRWKDVNGDGTITADDKKFLGSPLPKVTFGFTVNMDYKGFDFMVFAQGAAGNKIFQGLRRLDVANGNYTTEALSRWTGEGTSNSYPRLSTSDNNGNFTNMSDFYLEDGDYLRFKIVQLGYTLPSTIVNKAGLQKVRLYVTAENLFTLTKYTGYDPEIGGDVFGIDRGYYPQARSIMFGANLQF
ncbi:TonB-dependent receptor [Flavobacterium sp. J49]|uniref:SusC/RagA family TonB-linked outer membrane protein n=1 Tax=Flavobacterium sp. J49 TaxID=2718534 RepID=UPI001593B27B|nr:TonB-dependent receptor [Flavobacterium sp. J49]MBF6640174.1 TonB-dependent receptor [Flavobacterium sp. J49]NIC01419.1 TonB-dependent receptor [Flavobacterium sp. J49]